MTIGIPGTVWALARSIAEEMKAGHPASTAPTAALEFAVACDAAARAIMADRAARAPADGVREALVERVVEAVRPYTVATLFIEELRDLVRAALAGRPPTNP